MDDGIEHLEGELVDTAVLERHVGGVVDQDVDLAELLGGVCHQGLDAFGLGDVHVMVGRLAALSDDLVDDFLAAGLAAAADDNLRAFLGVHLGDADADAAGGAGDDCNLT